MGKLRKSDFLLKLQRVLKHYEGIRNEPTMLSKHMLAMEAARSGEFLVALSPNDPIVCAIVKIADTNARDWFQALGSIEDAWEYYQDKCASR